MQQLFIWQFIYNNLVQQNAVMLLYVVESEGSSPGRLGFFMAVNILGEMRGSIGGGIMEHKFVEMARSSLKHTKPECSLHTQIHDKSALRNQSGMICSGRQTNLLYGIRQNDVAYVKSMIDSIAGGLQGTLFLSPAGLSFKNTVDVIEGLNYVSDQHWQYTQRIGYRYNLHIIGAGHCALALSAVMRQLNFYIHLYDDRQSLNTYEENVNAHEKKIVNNYNEIETLIQPGKNVFVVVMTVGYRTDDIVLRSLQDKTFAYLGVLGSRNKIKKMFAEYRLSGVDEAFLQCISAPAGLPIKSQTPHEIAISIAAEIIKVKNSAGWF